MFPSILWSSSSRRCSDLFFKSLNCFARRAGPLFILIAVVLIGLSAYIYFNIVVPFHFPLEDEGVETDASQSSPTRANPWTYRLCLLWSVYMLACISFHYFMAVYTPPGSPSKTAAAMSLTLASRAPRKDGDSDSDTDEDSPNLICRKCNLPKPQRTHHCSVCNRCIYRFDHHCPWIHNCVGHFNYRYFLLFMIYLDVACLYYVLVAWGPLAFRLSHPWDADARFGDGKYDQAARALTLGSGLIVSSFQELESLLLLTVVIAAAIFLALLGMISWQLFLISTNQTTVEFYRFQYLRKVAKACGHGPQADTANEFDKGIVDNLKEFFNIGKHGSFSWYTIFLPVPIPPVGKGRVFATHYSKPVSTERDLSFEAMRNV